MIFYSDIDIKVSPSGDLTINSRGDLDLADPSGVLKQDIAFRLMTEYNDFTPHPDIGANLNELVGEPNTRENARIGEQKIIQSLTQDGRIATSDLTVTGVPVSLYNCAYFIFIRDGKTILNVTPDFSLDMNQGITTYG